MDLEISVLKVLHPHSSTFNLISDGSGIQNPGFGFWNCWGEMAFLHILPNFWHSCLFFKVERAEGAEKL